MKFLSCILCLFLGVAVFDTVLGVKQYITLYEDASQQGANLTLDRHYANLSEHKEFLAEVSSFCAVGWIAFYTNVDYNLEGGVAFMVDNGDAQPKCQNRIFSNYNSMRYLGNHDTDLPGVSLYSKTSYHGDEVFVNENGALSTNLTFPIYSLAITGWGNYTFYEGGNQTGPSWCLLSSQKVHLVAELDISQSIIGSVSMGCNSTTVMRL
ncbi:hypothetical protein Ocin01_04092 [Orchesella cincta]|uniref:Uncharacterized protein n=1 Tax=Orchesella cincta TaxID=48709 RepID=A0A1D2NBF0_ORCCI|nr:hypothetical protein Ocin01_04092 [Orchesella cincta]